MSILTLLAAFAASLARIRKEPLLWTMAAILAIDVPALLIAVWGVVFLSCLFARS